MADFTPDDTFTSPVPALSDGQPANAVVLNAPHQALVNRTHWLKETIDNAGITRDGATRIREVADEAALKALTGMQDGELAITQDKGLVFRFRAGVASSDIPRWVVQATSNEGLWVNTAFQLIGGPNGLVWTDPSGRIDADVPRNGLISIAFKGKTATATGPGAGSTNLALTAWGLDLGAVEVGDRVDVSFQFIVPTRAGMEHGRVVAALTIDGGPHPTDDTKDVAPTASIIGDYVSDVFNGFGCIEVREAGLAKLEFVLAVTGGTTWEIYATGIRANIYRP